MALRPLGTGLLCLVLGLGALSACGGDDSDGASGTTSAAAVAAGEDDAATSTGADDDADCRITTEQVTAAAGVEMEPIPGGGCGWQAPGLETAVFEVYFSGTDAMHYEGTDAEVLDIGDGAKFDLTGTLIVEYRGAHFMVQVLNIGGGAPAEPQEVAEELAQAVIDSY